jgi:hypothetical protein
MKVNTYNSISFYSFGFLFRQRVLYKRTDDYKSDVYRGYNVTDNDDRNHRIKPFHACVDISYLTVDMVKICLHIIHVGNKLMYRQHTANVMAVTTIWCAITYM